MVFARNPRQLVILIMGNIPDLRIGEFIAQHRLLKGNGVLLQSRIRVIIGVYRIGTVLVGKPDAALGCSPEVFLAALFRQKFNVHPKRELHSNIGI
ncbi:hypothetical protein D3C73_701710 [compost metagenome]